MLLQSLQKQCFRFLFDCVLRWKWFPPPPIQLPILKMAQNFEQWLLSCVSYFRQLSIMVFLKMSSWLLNMLFSTGATSWKKSHTSAKSKLVIVNWNLYWLHRTTQDHMGTISPFSHYLHSKLTKKVTLSCKVEYCVLYDLAFVLAISGGPKFTSEMWMQ